LENWRSNYLGIREEFKMKAYQVILKVKQFPVLREIASNLGVSLYDLTNMTVGRVDSSLLNKVPFFSAQYWGDTGADEDYNLIFAFNGERWLKLGYTETILSSRETTYSLEAESVGCQLAALVETGFIPTLIVECQKDGNRQVWTIYRPSENYRAERRFFLQSLAVAYESLKEDIEEVFPETH
jgi:hypothetical protein